MADAVVTVFVEGDTEVDFYGDARKGTTRIIRAVQQEGSDW